MPILASVTGLRIFLPDLEVYFLKPVENTFKINLKIEGVFPDAENIREVRFYFFIIMGIL